MLKSKFKLAILLLLVIALSTVSGFCIAVEVTPTADNSTIASPDASTVDVTPQQTEVPGDVITSVQAEDPETQPSTENQHSGDLFLCEDTINVSYIVDGNAYLMGKDVTITGQIYGNLYVCAENVKLDKCYIYNAAYIAAQTIDFNAACTDLYATGATFNGSYDCYVVRDAKIATEKVNFQGVIGRTLKLVANSIVFTDGDKSALIYGNLDYYSPSSIEISAGVVMGETNYHMIQNTLNSFNIKETVLSWIGFIVSSLVIFLLALWITPKFSKNSHKYISLRLFAALGIGILSMVIGIILFVLCLIIQPLAFIGILLLLLLSLGLLLGKYILMISIVNYLKVKTAFGKNILFNLIAVVIVSTIIFALGLIPYAGIFIDILLVLIGFGILVMNILRISKASNSDDETQPTTSVDTNSNNDAISK